MSSASSQPQEFFSSPSNRPTLPNYLQLQPPIVTASIIGGCFSLFANKISFIGALTRFPTLRGFYNQILYFWGNLLFTSNIKTDLQKSNDDVVVRKGLTSSNKRNPIASTHPLSSAKEIGHFLLEHLSKRLNSLF